MEASSEGSKATNVEGRFRVPKKVCTEGEADVEGMTLTLCLGMVSLLEKKLKEGTKAFLVIRLNYGPLESL